jgi:beta-glucosidase
VWGPEDGDERDADAVRRADNALNGLFFGPIFHGAYPDGFLDDTAHLTDHAFIRTGDLSTMSAPLDNLGVNNYFPTRVRAARNGEESTNRMPGCAGVVETDPRPPLTDMGWEMSPESHRLILERSARESGLPIYITENGSAWPDTVSEDGEVHDPERVSYLHGHLEAVADAIENGVDIRGYFAWSLLDNFEWAYGYEKRFGIVHVDYDTLERTVKDSGREYARIIAEHHSR